MASNINLCVPRMVLVEEDELERLKRLEANLQAILEKAKIQSHTDKNEVYEKDILNNIIQIMQNNSSNQR